MPKITAIIHTHNDGQRLGRALDSLRPCAEVLVIDHGSVDDTQRIARQHGARVKLAVAGVEDGAYLSHAANDWVLCLQPSEALSEALEASLFEWKERAPGAAAGFSVQVREESKQGWKLCPPEMRLVDRTRVGCAGALPPNVSGTTLLAGDLLRFRE